VRAPLWAARCRGRIGVRDFRCSSVRLPLWAAHWSARTALLRSANAGAGDALRSLHPNAEEFRCSAVRGLRGVSKSNRKPRRCWKKKYGVRARLDSWS